MAITINGNGTITGVTSGAGKILQVVQAIKTAPFSTASTSFTDVTDLTLSITPSSASNKIIVCGYLFLSANYNGSNPARARITRNGTAVFIGDTNGSRSRGIATHAWNQYSNAQAIGFTYLDSPGSTSAVTYKWQVAAESTGAPAIVGYTASDGSTFISAPTNLVAMEVQG